MGMKETRKTVGTTLGLLAPIVAIATFLFWFYTNNSVGIPENRGVFIAVFVIAIVMAVASFIVGTRWFGGVAAVVGFLPAAFMLFTVSISKQVVAEDAIKVGDSLPYFAALDDKGERFTSDALAGTPVLIKFFRAHW